MRVFPLTFLLSGKRGPGVVSRESGEAIGKIGGKHCGEFDAAVLLLVIFVDCCQGATDGQAAAV